MKPRSPIILQRVITHYRRPFFEAVYNRYGWRVVAAEYPPSGTFLNLVDPKDLPYADTVPMNFSSNGHNCLIDVNALIEKFQPPAILAEFSMRMSSSYTLPVARRLGKVQRLAFWTHGWSMDRPFQTMADYASHFGRLPLFYASDHVLTYSEEGARWVRRFLKEEKVSALGNAVDSTPILDAAALAKPALLGRPALLSVGRLTADKDFARLIRTFKRINSSYGGATLTIVGDGPELDRLSALAGDGLGKSIFLPGAIYSEDKLAPLFLAADLFVLSGAAGLSVNHALTYGLPIVAFPRGRDGPFHHPEIEYVQHGQTGWYADEYSDDALMRAIVEALENMCSDKAKIRIKEFARAKLSMDVMVDRFGKFISKL